MARECVEKVAVRERTSVVVDDRDPVGIGGGDAPEPEPGAVHGKSDYCFLHGGRLPRPAARLTTILEVASIVRVLRLERRKVLGLGEEGLGRGDGLGEPLHSAKRAVSASR